MELTPLQRLVFELREVEGRATDLPALPDRIVQRVLQAATKE